uniref:Uncharacterized protein n=1 Tax=Setaria viridis TaxID=4556 RepID=A0A4U6T9W9_SETVI|nr:hypothetical protein SEVIR_9G581300v2 [Setaria viridis]
MPGVLKELIELSLNMNPKGPTIPHQPIYNIGIPLGRLSSGEFEEPRYQDQSTRQEPSRRVEVPNRQIYGETELMRSAFQSKIELVSTAGCCIWLIDQGRGKSELSWEIKQTEGPTP